MHASPSRERGFTRADLVGLLAAFTLLAALPLPIFGNHRQATRATACLDNFHRLTTAWLMYAADGEGWFVPNIDLSTGPVWVQGQAGPGGADEFRSSILSNPATSMLAGYLAEPTQVFRCPGDLREGRYQGTDPTLTGRFVSAARSVAMNGAVGSKPNAKAATDGPWLDNNHAHVSGQAWHTYGRESHLTRPGPGLTSVFIDEDAWSINEGYFAFGMMNAEWIDWPATRHDLGATLSFADGHAELRRWVDRRTRVPYSQVRRLNVPGSADWEWLRDRTSARLEK